jgi:hypothetical protein
MKETRLRGVAIISPAVGLAHVTITAKGAGRANFKTSVVESSSKITATGDADSLEGAPHKTHPDKKEH